MRYRMTDKHRIPRQSGESSQEDSQALMFLDANSKFMHFTDNETSKNASSYFSKKDLTWLTNSSILLPVVPNGGNI